jgi:hypothetical protein
MNSKDIVRMAREAGFPICEGFFGEMMETFARLVAAHEKEKCANTVEELLNEVLKLTPNDSATNRFLINVVAHFKEDITAAIRARGRE